MTATRAFACTFHNGNTKMWLVFDCFKMPQVTDFLKGFYLIRKQSFNCHCQAIFSHSRSDHHRSNAFQGYDAILKILNQQKVVVR